MKSMLKTFILGDQCICEDMSLIMHNCLHSTRETQSLGTSQRGQFLRQRLSDHVKDRKPVNFLNYNKQLKTGQV